LIQQYDVVPELVMFSIPPGYVTGSEYIFDAAAGQGITIYIIDAGFNLNHEVYILLF